METEKEKLDVVGLMMDFEDGSISKYNFYKLFSYLIKTRQAWRLQGFYGRTAKAIIESGYISEDGTINWKRIGED